jgi:hypothetical protein
VVALAIFLASLALYANTLGHAFVWDDYDLIVHNPEVKTLDASTVSKIFRQDLWTPARTTGRARLDARYGSIQPYYRPLVTLSYHLDYTLFNGNPAGFHAVNVLANAVTCSLAFAFVYVLFQSVLLAAVAALLFAVHPAHVEAVAWIAGRTDVFATLWSLASLSLYVVARRRKRAGYWLASLAAFMLAMLSKEVAVAVPFLVVLLELGPFKTLFDSSATGRPTSSRRVEAGAVLRIGAFFVVLALYFVLRRALIGNAFSEGLPTAPGMLGYVGVPLTLLAGYVSKVLFPIMLTAVFWVPIPTSLASPWPVAGAILAALIAWSIWRFRARPDVVLGIGIFVLGLLPVLHLIPLGTLSAERFLFFPSLGVALIFAAVFAGALTVRFPALKGVDTARARRMPSPLAAALVTFMAVMCVVFAARTVTRNPDWKNNDILFAKTAEQTGGGEQASHTLVVLRMLATNAHEKGDIKTAVEYYERMVELAPDYAMPHWNLGLIRLQKGETAAAREHFVRAARGGPDFRAAYYHLAVIDKAAGNTESAREYARQFLVLYDKDDRYRREAEAIARGE